MEHSNLLSNNGSRSHAFDRERLLAVLGPGNLDFRGKPTKTNAFTLLHGVEPETKNASDLGRFVRTTLQHHYNWAILDNAKLYYVLDRLRNFTASVTSYVHEHPWETAFALLSVLSITIVPVILPAIGFSAIGPVAESIAAAWQSSIGIVAAGTPFAFLQGAAMGGAAAGVFYGAGFAGLAVLAGKQAVDWAVGWWHRE